MKCFEYLCLIVFAAGHLMPSNALGQESSSVPVEDQIATAVAESTDACKEIVTKRESFYKSDQDKWDGKGSGTRTLRVRHATNSNCVFSDFTFQAAGNISMQKEPLVRVLLPAETLTRSYVNCTDAPIEGREEREMLNRKVVEVTLSKALSRIQNETSTVSFSTSKSTSISVGANVYNVAVTDSDAESSAASETISISETVSVNLTTTRSQSDETVQRTLVPERYRISPRSILVVKGTRARSEVHARFEASVILDGMVTVVDIPENRLAPFDVDRSAYISELPLFSDPKKRTYPITGTMRVLEEGEYTWSYRTKPISIKDRALYCPTL